MGMVFCAGIRSRACKLGGRSGNGNGDQGIDFDLDCLNCFEHEIWRICAGEALLHGILRMEFGVDGNGKWLDSAHILLRTRS